MSGIGTGNGTTIAFPTTGVTGKFTMIGEVKEKIGKENVSNLESEDYEEYALNDLADMDDTPFEMLLDNESELPPLGTLELIVITHATRAGQGTPASYAAWGAISERTLPKAVNNETMKLAGAITWLNRDGSGDQVKPLWTKATLET